jgi:Sec-independent protein translocase protein TatA
MDFAIVLILILIVALVWRGPRTLPQIGAMLGRGFRDVRREVRRDDARPDANQAKPGAASPEAPGTETTRAEDHGHGPR